MSKGGIIEYKGVGSRHTCTLVQLCRSVTVLTPHLVQKGELGVWLHLLYSHVLMGNLWAVMSICSCIGSKFCKLRVYKRMCRV